MATQTPRPVQDGPSLLKMLAKRKHIQTYAAFRQQFSSAAGELARLAGDERLAQVTVSRRQLDRWFAGAVKTAPRPDQCRILEHMFKRPASDLLQPALKETVMGTVPSGRGPLSDRPRQEVKDIQVRARSTARRVVDLNNRKVVGEETVEYLFERAQTLGHDYHSQPFWTFLQGLTDLQDHAFHLMSDLRPSNSELRDLNLLMGVMCGIGALASYDAGQFLVAVDQVRAAAICARESHHRGLVSWVYGLRALMAFYEGHPYEAISHATAGLQSLGGHGGSVGVWLPALQARALGMAGLDDKCEAAIQLTEAAAERQTFDVLDEMGGMFDFSVPRRLQYVSEARLFCHRLSDDVERQATDSVQASSGRQHDGWDVACENAARVVLGRFQVMTGDIDSALSTLHPLLQSDPRQHPRGILMNLVRLGYVTDGQSDATVELQARLIDLQAFLQGNEETHNSLIQYIRS